MLHSHARSRTTAHVYFLSSPSYYLYRSGLVLPHSPTEPPLPILNNRSHKIVFKHPAYPDDFGQNTHLTFFAWDAPGGGFHADTALIACAILASNAFNGCFTTKRGGDRLDIDRASVLPVGSYYFNVPHPQNEPAATDTTQASYKYAVYPSFAHWAFPRHETPAWWLDQPSDLDFGDDVREETASTPSISALSAAVLARDQACAISKHKDYMERAHLCPRAETEWFKENGMREYNDRLDLSGDFVTDVLANAIAMRADVHRAFDDSKFVIVRKAGVWTAHFLELTHDLGGLYHNRSVALASGVSARFILVRLAWAIFPRVRLFLECGVPRQLRIRVKKETGVSEVEQNTEVQEISRLLGSNRGHSSSPKKRKASDTIPDMVGDVGAKRQRNNQTSPHRSLTAPERTMPHLVSDESRVSQESVATEAHHRKLLTSAGEEDTLAQEALRWSELRAATLTQQRPKDPRLLCCDYTLAETANEIGIEGRPEYGGGHLCARCLGLNILDDDVLNYEAT